QTIGAEAAIEGVGLHTGQTAHLRFLPADTHAGVRFRRTDLSGAPEIEARLERVASTDRGTTLANGDARAHTVEHLLAAVAALQIDNLIIEIDGPEIPILDGSFRPFFETLAAAGVQAQDAPARLITLTTPVLTG